MPKYNQNLSSNWREKSTCEILCHYFTWVLNASSVNLIKNVLTSFSKMYRQQWHFSVTTDVGPNSLNKSSLYTGENSLWLKGIIQKTAGSTFQKL